MTFTCTKCGNYSDDGDFEACICLRCIDKGAGKEQEQRKWHHIDAPTVRSLNPNEQKVYSLLRMGYTPKEVARQLHMPYGDEFFCNVHDVTCDTVRHLITSIREKGWEIPQENEEEDEDVQKYTDKQKEKALQLFEQGMKPMAIAEKMRIKYKTVSKWTCDYKKQKAELDAVDLVENECAEIKAQKEEPASAATDTDSESESLGKNSDIIIPENTEIVKLPEALPTVVFDAILEKKDAVLKMIADEEQHLKSLYADLAVLDEFICREGVIGE